MTDDLYDLNGLATSLAATLRELLAEAGVAEAALPAVELALPARPEHGDLTTNAAMVSAKCAGRPPRDLAAALGERWQAGPGAALCDRVEVAGPGFLNLFLDAAWYRGALERMRAAGHDFGRDALPHGERLKMNVEFVSVNPTGPLHVGHARYASYGDALCRIFAFVGHDVTREFYVNDYGTQMLRFGQSLAARYGQRLDLDTPVPEEGYQGEYLLDLADDLIAALADLDGEDLLYDEEGAVWLKTTRYGDDKDRVLIRSSGDPTYFLSDIAYHRDKMDRGFAHMIDVWGADHHG